MHISRRFLKNILSLQKYCKIYELRYQILHVFSIILNLMTIITFATGPGVNSLKSNLSSWATT